MEDEKQKPRVFEILFIVSILVVLAALIIPAIINRRPKGFRSPSLLGTISVALQEYSTDFNGVYPPDDCEIVSAGFFGGRVKIKNSSHALCVYLTANNISDDGRPSGNYLPFQRRNLFNEGKKTFSFNYQYSAGGEMLIKGVDDYVVDSFSNPVVYDERKSEQDNDGLNFESFVLISGGAWDRKEDVSLKDVDKGDLSMFPEENMKNIDTQPSDYKDSIPNYSFDENDDLFNM